MDAYLVKPRGFCAGVVRAVDIVDIALEKFPHPIYVRKEIVHNRYVVDGFRARGVVFIDSLNEAPDGSVVIYSAHGVSPEVRNEASHRGLFVIDATCPLVAKVHMEVHRFIQEGCTIVLIGHKGHDEVIGTMGESPGKIQLVGSVEEVGRLAVPDPEKLVCLTQTTLSVDETQDVVGALKKKFPKLRFPPKDDICYATQNRQDAVKELVKMEMDLLLVVGSKNSSNSLRLCEVAQFHGVEAHLIDDASEVEPVWLEGVKKVGVTAGASAPENLVQDVVNLLGKKGAKIQEIDVIGEDVSFGLPRELMEAAPAQR